MCTQTQETIAEFLARYPVEMTLQEVPGNPNMHTDSEYSMYHWHVTFSFQNRTMQTYYSTGCGHCTKKRRKNVHPVSHSHEHYQIQDHRTGRRSMPSALVVKYLEPKRPALADILDCLASDSDVLNYSTFEEWAECLGMDTDSRKGEATYKLCIEQAIQLRNLLEPKLFLELLECERL